MAMFKSKDDEGATYDGGSDKMNTIVGKDTVFSGNLDVTGTLRVDGVVKGDVTVSDTIAIGPTGTVEANVKTKNAVVSGQVNGNIHATERIELQAKANIAGDLVTKCLVIEQGALFHGNCNMKMVPPLPPSPALATTRPEGLRLPIPPKAPVEIVERTR
ncbi:MAG: polymer-forming cytoskeletal protein [candidate division Zixibacteria bacterium]|nr:polymer-forming cytoskeletal protein [candidate division Zixibacteria bacterium]